MVIDAVVALLVILTLSVVTAMLAAGLIGVLRPVRLVRCPSCQHMARTVPASATACVHCHYQRVLHALHLPRGAGHEITIP
jgi:hypothetical protein